MTNAYHQERALLAMIDAAKTLLACPSTQPYRLLPEWRALADAVEIGEASL